MYKIFCDMCGKDTTNNYGSMELELPYHEKNGVICDKHIQMRPFKKHFCNDCCGELLKFIANQGKEK